jgi:hypothetical protein
MQYISENPTATSISNQATMDKIATYLKATAPLSAATFNLGVAPTSKARAGGGGWWEGMR